MLNDLVRFNAGLIIAILGLLFILEPFLIGTSRPKKSENYTVEDWVGTLLGIALFLPVCGRVLVWW